MTKPTVTITYRHSFLHDCDTLVMDSGSEGKWTETDTNNIATWATDGDIITATVTPTADGQYAQIEYHLSTNPSTTSYPKLYIRWKTSDSGTPGVKATVIATYLSGSTTTVLGYSTSYGFNEVTLTSGTSLDKIALKVTSDRATTGTHYVYFDFILVCAGKFTFPNVAYGLKFNPPTRYVDLAIPSRMTDITQMLGAENATVECDCDLDIVENDGVTESDNWKRPQGSISKTDVKRGQVFDEIAHNSKTEPFQWLDTGSEQFKVTMRNPSFSREPGTQRFNCVFEEYSLTNKNMETYIERFGLH